MTALQEQSWDFLDACHEQRSFELGESPEELETPYSVGADAIRRIAAVDAKETAK